MSKVMKVLPVVLVLVLLFFMLRPYVIVPAGHCAVILNLASRQYRQVGEGFHLVMPVADQVEFFDLRKQTYSMSKTSWEGEVRGDDSMRALTADGQEATVELSLRFRLDPQNVWKLRRDIGRDYISKIIRPEMRSHVRIAIAEFPASKVYSSERRTVESNIENRLRETLAKNYIIVEEILLRDVRFSDAYQAAIIQKQIAQQNAERMKYVLEKEKLEKQRKVILAEGEAEAIRLKGQAIAQNSRIVSYEYAMKVAPNIKGIITSGGGIPVPGIGGGGQ
ncbi:MAG: prohibitin family protein [Abditibacteriales bacterium]|nr:prohibitin family protein [Abditibacteriales bacterium]MDW8366888.1 prohibitin family protein [Abditibacteriales bacterium]